ncbi:Brp/Blh family beta-carotene 15,15'-dioxygenase [Polynucleobacter brandtiae]|uniref:Probable beta-carotene 15,15'-dioxygenase n=1 Tax=Polynucleobacter brandtiae TaxID=1938816 RepID=A0A2M8VQ97_9BURK|nr:Brp/Blh family beta-carotene 15,15'-dioxygenase [Polynucleobacter brandtiae]PJI79296.1 Brp/Blh family beta-carotene 15,15'-monooxygenase [Polynucleobacter brandtiae]
MNLRLQGQLFCTFSFFVILVYLLGFSLDKKVEWLVLIALITLLGIPHGALDAILAKPLYKINSPMQWLIFLTAYLALAAAVVLIWWAAPTFFLIGFLIISAIHFSTDIEGHFSRIYRFTYGSCILVLPALLYAPEMHILFAFVAGEEAANMVMAGLRPIAIPWLIASIFLAVAHIRKDRFSSVEFLAVIAVASFLPPLLAFTIFFCGMHGPRHIMRAYRFANLDSGTALLKAMILPMIFVLGAFISAWVLFPSTQLDGQLIQILFVILAALTVPHMLVIDRLSHASSSGY